MPKKFICKSCNELVDANIRIKGEQKYCGKKKCQQARKTEWQHNKIASDPSYRKRQKECQEKWKRNKPLDQYQKKYREAHPDYVAKNRDQQKERYNQRRDQTLLLFSEKIVKMDALNEASIKSNVYVMNTYTMDTCQKIVKMDTLFVQLIPYQGVRPQHPGSG